MKSNTRALAEKLRRYHRMNHRLGGAEAILVPCDHT
jgi:hypothetical protein